MIETALKILTVPEYTAALFALILGTLITEGLKRAHRASAANPAPPLVYAAVGCLVTGVVGAYLWPPAGLFPHRYLMGLFLGLAAPVLYRATTAALRHFGLGWLADVISGQPAAAKDAAAKDAGAP